MSETPDDDPGTAVDVDVDVDELRDLVEELADANDAVREYGDDHGIPAVERTAKRIDGTIATLRQNVPGALSDREE